MASGSHLIRWHGFGRYAGTGWKPSGVSVLNTTGRLELGIRSRIIPSWSLRSVSLAPSGTSRWDCAQGFHTTLGRFCVVIIYELLHVRRVKGRPKKHSESA